MIYIKSKKEIELMRASANILKKVLSKVEANIEEGVTTSYLDAIADRVIKENKAIPSFKGVECPYRGGKTYSNALCISINDEIIHGMPSARVLRKGDLVSIDLGVFKDGYHSDAGRTYIVSEGTTVAKKIVSVTEKAFFAGVGKAIPGNRIGDISYAIQKTVEDAGFNLVKEYQGHGIGKSLHEDPGVPNIGRPSRGERLEVGMALAIEPMVVEKSADIVVGDDKWVVKTKDGGISSYYENTIIITEEGPEILTL